MPDWRSATDEANRSAGKFLVEGKAIEEHVRAGDNKVLISPTFYKERMKEAKKIGLENQISQHLAHADGHRGSGRWERE